MSRTQWAMKDSNLRPPACRTRGRAELPYGHQPLCSVVFGEPNPTYHSDREHWSNSQLTVFRNDGPAAFHARCIARTALSPPSEGQRRGTNVHLWAELGDEEFRRRIALAPEEFVTGAGALSAKARPWLADLPPEAIPLTRHEADSLLKQCEAILANPAAARLLGEVEWREFSIRWTDDFGHRLRCRPDAATPELFLDLKTTKDKHPFSTWWKACRDYRYAQQAALYGWGAAQVNWPAHSLHFIVTSSVPDYECVVVTLPERWVRAEERALLRALDEIDHRQSLDCWTHDHYGQVVELPVPRHAMEE